MLKTPEEMRELSSKYGMKFSSGDPIDNYIMDCQEFVPYAAEWMIKAKELLIQASIEFDYLDNELGMEIDNFLESPHETK